QLCAGEQLGLAELGHVREHRHVQCGAHPLELRQVPQRLGEDRVGARVDQRLHPVDGGVQPVGGAQVGAGHHEEVRVPSAVGGGADALGGGGQVHHRLAVEVAAALGIDLVLDVAAGQARVL